MRWQLGWIILQPSISLPLTTLLNIYWEAGLQTSPCPLQPTRSSQHISLGSLKLHTMTVPQECLPVVPMNSGTKGKAAGNDQGHINPSPPLLTYPPASRSALLSPLVVLWPPSAQDPTGVRPGGEEEKGRNSWTPEWRGCALALGLLLLTDSLSNMPCP